MVEPPLVAPTLAEPPRFETLRLDIEHRVAHVQLARPDSANAMNLVLWRELGAVFDWLDGEPAVRAVVLSGQGRHFCAGMDLQVFAELGRSRAASASPQSEPPASAGQLHGLGLHDLIVRLQASLTAIERCRKPVLAAVHGACLGGGLAMVACCDTRYAAVDSRFAIKEIDLGMTADVGSLQRLPHLMPRGLVHELAYTGRDMSAEEAFRCGLVTALCADGQAVRQHALGIAASIATKAPTAIRGSKGVLLHGRDHPVAAGLEYVASWNAGMLNADDVGKALSAAPGSDPEFED